MNIKDRTIEFQQSVLTFKKQFNNNTNNNKTNHDIKRSEFQKKASNIAHEVSLSAKLLSKLAILSKAKPMFNDNSIEVAELSFLIKRKIYLIEQNLIDLSKYQKTIQGKENIVVKNGKDLNHSKNVINLLNTKVKNISGNFKNVLEKRQELELQNKGRWEKINTNNNNNANNTTTDTNNANNAPTDTNANINTIHNNTNYNNSNPFLSSVQVADEEEEKYLNNNNNNATDNQMLLLSMEEGLLSQSDNTNVYLQQRDRAMETIESTIQEVGNMFQQLASMVQEQGEVIQRIDANVEDIDLNISGAQRELLKYFDRIKSNRWLAVKVFFIIFVFFLVWVLVN